MIKLLEFTLGPLANNSYLIVDVESRDAVIIDPSFDSSRLTATLNSGGYHLKQIWITHAHFDHTIGIFDLPLDGVKIALHIADLGLWNTGGGASNFNIPINNYPKPSWDLNTMTTLELGGTKVQVLHTPGHTAGHVVFYFPIEKMVFAGDLIFKNGIGRTDLPGGNHTELMKSITEKIYTLPGDVRILSGHGPGTTVSAEMQNNLFFV